ncbi:hypothetical protein EON77_00670 [bacterium]|nr:MAG: hypothetical protein EON77_00670 [bacterium]
MIKPLVLSALRHVLRPLVRIVLRNGVTWNEFAEVGREVFVQIAREDYGIDGRPTNSARVALMTGLSRRDVMRLKGVLTGERPPDVPAPGRISQILTAWHVDPRFLAADGEPAVLPGAGEGASLAMLLRHYAGDAPHVAITKELEELGLVERTVHGYRVLAREYIRSASDPDRLRQASAALHDHATTIAWNIDASRSTPARFERMASNRALPRRHVRAFEEFVQGEGQALLSRIDQWLSTHAAAADEEPASARDRPVRAGLGLYLIHDESQQGTPR